MAKIKLVPAMVFAMLFSILGNADAGLIHIDIGITQPHLVAIDSSIFDHLWDDGSTEGEVLLERWGRTGIGHTEPILHYPYSRNVVIGAQLSIAQASGITPKSTEYEGLWYYASVDDREFSTSFPSIRVHNDDFDSSGRVFDGFTVRSTANSEITFPIDIPDNYQKSMRLELSVETETRQLYTDTSYPDSFDLNDFENAFVIMEASNDQDVYFSLTMDITYFQTSVITITKPVPEPTTFLLFASGLIGLAGFRKKLRKP